MVKEEREEHKGDEEKKYFYTAQVAITACKRKQLSAEQAEQREEERRL